MFVQIIQAIMDNFKLQYNPIEMQSERTFELWST